MLISILTIPKTCPNIDKFFSSCVPKHSENKYFKNYNCVLCNANNTTLKMVVLLFGRSLSGKIYSASPQLILKVENLKFLW